MAFSQRDGGFVPVNSGHWGVRLFKVDVEGWSRAVRAGHGRSAQAGSTMRGVRRFLPALAAFALVIVGVVGGLALLTARDHGGLTTNATPASNDPTGGPAGLPPGNVVVEYVTDDDRDAVDALASQLGAVDAPATRAAGQALVSKHVRSATGIRAVTATTSLALPSAKDPRLAAFVREHLGRTDQR